MHMNARAVLNVIAALESANLFFCVDGGWGVDALLGEQTREHRDLDLIADSREAAQLRDVLGDLGYCSKADENATNFILIDGEGRVIDVHTLRIDERGVGFFPIPEGGEWPFPRKALEGRGMICDHPVRCLSVDAQTQCHGQGYRPSENDWHDMQRLQDRFGVVLPLHFYRQ